MSVEGIESGAATSAGHVCEERNQSAVSLERGCWVAAA